MEEAFQEGVFCVGWELLLVLTLTFTFRIFYVHKFIYKTLEKKQKSWIDLPEISL